MHRGRGVCVAYGVYGMCSTVQAHTVGRTVRICRMLARNVQSEINGYRVLPRRVATNQWIWVDSSGPHVDRR